MASRVMLIDSASLYFRAFFGMKDPVVAPDGTPVNAVRGFLDMIATLVRTRNPDRLVCCWDDDWRPQFRVDAIASYKSHRVADAATNSEETPPGLDVQVPLIIEALRSLGIARLGGPGLEADDVIGTLTTRAVRQANGAADVDVVTGDRDLFQLVNDAAGVRVLYTGRGLRHLETIDQTRLSQKYGVATGDQYAVMAALRGDPSDGLPGVPGIGEKTAAALVSRYPDLPTLRAAAQDPTSDLTPAVRRRVNDAAPYLDVAMQVVNVVRHADLPELGDTLPIAPPDPAAVAEFAERWNVSSSMARLVSAMSNRPHPTPA